jgi:hypothetical protein
MDQVMSALSHQNLKNLSWLAEAGWKMKNCSRTSHPLLKEQAIRRSKKAHQK